MLGVAKHLRSVGFVNDSSQEARGFREKKKNKNDEAFLFSYPLTDAEKPHSGLRYKVAL